MTHRYDIAENGEYLGQAEFDGTADELQRWIDELDAGVQEILRQRLREKTAEREAMQREIDAVDAVLNAFEEGR